MTIVATAAETLAWLEQNAPNALLLEPREHFDAAIVGRTCRPTDHWPREGDIWVVIYDSDLCIDAIQKWMECEDEDAMDWFDYNTAGAWMGEGTPTFRYPEDHY